MVTVNYKRLIWATALLCVSSLYTTASQAFTYYVCNQSNRKANLAFEFHCPMYYMPEFIGGGKADKVTLDLEPGQRKPVTPPGVPGTCPLATDSFIINGEKASYDTEGTTIFSDASLMLSYDKATNKWKIHETKGTQTCRVED